MIKITEDVFKESIKRLTKTDDGKILMAYLARSCFWSRPAFRNGDEKATYVQAAIQNIYYKLRDYIDVKELKSIEYDYQIEPQGAKNERRDGD